MATDQRAAVSVLIPTIGRPELLLGTLQSLAACVPAPAEIVMSIRAPIQQAHRWSTGWLCKLWIVLSEGRGRGLAVNEGLRAASNEIVAIVDDDCVLGRKWIGVVDPELSADDSAIICGQVLASGDPARIPSTLALGEPRDYTGQASGDVLYAGNMACRRQEVLAAGALTSGSSPPPRTATSAIAGCSPDAACVTSRI